MESGIYQPPIRSLMDDFTVSTTTHTHVRLILSAWEGSISWTRMKIKANKYKYLELRKGRVDRRHKMQIQRKEVRSIVESPIKCLGKWFNDKESIEFTNKNTQIRSSYPG